METTHELKSRYQFCLSQLKTQYKKVHLEEEKKRNYFLVVQSKGSTCP